VEERRIAHGVSADRSPVLRADVLAGRFHRFACPCGATLHVDVSLVWFEWERRRWFVVFPERFEDEWRRYEAQAAQIGRSSIGVDAPSVARDLGEGMAMRVVFGADALAEKLAICDAGLDDGVVAAMSLDLMRAPLGCLDPGSRPRFSGLEGGRMRFRVPGYEAPLFVDESRHAALALDPRWQGCIRTVSAGPYVDVGRLLIGGGTANA
jgi:hypothetical protein